MKAKIKLFTLIGVSGAVLVVSVKRYIKKVEKELEEEWKGTSKW